MLRVLTFDGLNATHKLYFGLLYNDAFGTRGSAGPQDRVSTEEKRKDGRIARAFKAISQPIDGSAAPADGQLDLRKRALLPAGGTLRLAQDDFKRLQTFVEKTQWFAAVSDIAIDLEDWLDTADKVDESVNAESATPAGPQPVATRGRR